MVLVLETPEKSRFAVPASRFWFSLRDMIVRFFNGATGDPSPAVCRVDDTGMRFVLAAAAAMLDGPSL